MQFRPEEVGCQSLIAEKSAANGCQVPTIGSSTWAAWSFRLLRLRRARRVIEPQHGRNGLGILDGPAQDHADDGR